jgi:hypothetical protein
MIYNLPFNKYLDCFVAIPSKFNNTLWMVHSLFLQVRQRDSSHTIRHNALQRQFTMADALRIITQCSEAFPSHREMFPIPLPLRFSSDLVII